MLLQYLYRKSQEPARGHLVGALIVVLIASILKIRYVCTVLRLKFYKRYRKLRVMFVVGDSSKWKGQLVYERMLASDHYDPYIVPTFVDMGWVPDNVLLDKLKACTEFFRNRKMRMLDICPAPYYKPLPLKIFSPDIVIYQQPHGMPECHMPISASECALTAYMLYCVTIHGSLWGQFQMPFIRFLYVFFAENQLWIDFYRSTASRFHVGAKMFPAGCPIREEIVANCNHVTTTNAVIYAPHWSFPHPKNLGSSDISTFLWSGRPVLEYARRHPEIQWIFKPHPILRIKLETCGVMSKKEIDNYYGAWEKIGIVCYDSNYIDLFHSAKAMVTDSDSFLIEFSITGKPLIRLVPEDDRLTMPAIAHLMDAFYQVGSCGDMERIFKQVIEDDEDPMKESRLSILAEYGYDKNNVAGRIIEYFDHII